MASVNSRQNYLRALREEQTLGVISGERPETTLEEARIELAQALSRVARSILRDKYGPLVGVISEPAVTEVLKNFETNLARAKGDFTILLEEVFDRLIPSTLKKKSDTR
jgi:hypothetical protein